MRSGAGRGSEGNRRGKRHSSQLHLRTQLSASHNLIISHICMQPERKLEIQFDEVDCRFVFLSCSVRFKNTSIEVDKTIYRWVLNETGAIR